VALRTASGEVTAAGYVREPVTFDLIANGTTAANTASIYWPEAKDNWGTITYIDVYDAATGGTRLGIFEPVTITTVSRYERCYIPAAAFQVVSAHIAIGFGTFTWGINSYGTAPSGIAPISSGIGTPYDSGGYGYGPYERTGQDQGVLLLKIFAPVWLCGGEPADWAPHGPYEMA
jgi:hypothetical protein